MPPRKKTPNDSIEELLAKIAAINLWTAGASQGNIAKALGKSKSWVNDLLKGVPKPVRTATD